MSIAQEQAALRIQEIQAKLAKQPLSQQEELDLKLELFPMIVIRDSEHDLSWWDPETSCPLEMVCDWLEEQYYLDQNVVDTY